MANPKELVSIIDSYIRNGWVKEVGVHSTNLLTDRTVLEYNPAKVFYPASTIKVAIGCEVLRQVEVGTISPEQPVEAGRLVGGSGLLKLMGKDIKVTVSSLLSLMLTVSDNSASNWLIQLVGAANVNKMLSFYSLNQTYLGGKFMARERKKRVNRTSARDMSELMRLLHQRKMVSPAVSSRLIKILGFQQDTSMIQAGLPGWWVRRANKPGAMVDLRADVGLVWGNGYAYTLAVFDRGFDDFYRGESLIREISHGLFNVLGKWPDGKGRLLH